MFEGGGLLQLEAHNTAVGLSALPGCGSESFSARPRHAEPAGKHRAALLVFPDTQLPPDPACCAIRPVSIGASDIQQRTQAGTRKRPGVGMTKILIADDHEVVRAGLRALLSEQPDWQVVAEAADGKEAVAQALKTAPDVAIVDYSLPVLNGVEVTRQIRQRSPSTEVIIFTHDNNSLIHDLLQAGALGYLLKSDAKRLLLTAVETVAEHKPFFTGMVSKTLLQSFLTKGNDSPLTARERAVLQLIAVGHSNKRAAASLSLSVKTIETHRGAVCRKLNIHSTAALVRYAVRNKIIEA
jgi:DNA-binding NarL/FixJ family response regulator